MITGLAMEGAGAIVNHGAKVAPASKRCERSSIMDSTAGPASGKLTGTTSAFVLAAAITVLFNTVLACAKDAYAPLKAFLKSLTGNDWTTHGLLDLVLFAGLGFIFMSLRMAEKIGAGRLIAVLIGAVVIAGLGLALWFAFV